MIYEHRKFKNLQNLSNLCILFIWFQQLNIGCIHCSNKLLRIAQKVLKHLFPLQQILSSSIRLKAINTTLTNWVGAVFFSQ